MELPEFYKFLLTDLFYVVLSQQMQHYTNQLAKETNKHLKELGSLPLPLSPSEQVSSFSHCKDAFKPRAVKHI